ncbi:hypothetical protein ACIF9R_09710 [Streptomyces sp. NPDC086080]|uniref:hypothetical protein n=1 Tax=Streptomyces sp. NPDC086080 TaxID=3365748 RepID=UPI0037D6285F
MSRQDDIREAGQWLGVVDPMWSGAGRPPEWAMTGRWRSGPDGARAASSVPTEAVQPVRGTDA